MYATNNKVYVKIIIERHLFQNNYFMLIFSNVIEQRKIVKATEYGRN